jgi:type IV secretion system protein VirB4
MLIRKAQTSKKVQLNVDSISYWTATNNAKDNLLKREYFELYGIPEGLRRLARDYSFSPHRTSEPTTGLRPAAAPTKELRPAAGHTMPRAAFTDTEIQTGVVQ